MFSTAIYSTLNAKKLVDLGSLTTKLCLLISTYPASTVHVFSDNFRLWSHISREWNKISINGKRRLQQWSIPHRTQTRCAWVHKKNKVLLSHFEPPKFNMVLAIHMYMIMQLRSGHVTLLQRKFQPLNCPPIGLTAPGGLTLGSAP